MKKLIEAYKNEERTQYAEVLFTIILCFNVPGVREWLNNYGVFVNDTTITALGIVIGIPMVLYIFRAWSHDSKRTRDERGIWHDYLVTNTGYHVLVALLGLYLFLVRFDLILLGILVVVLVARLWKRMILEVEA